MRKFLIAAAAAVMPLFCQGVAMADGSFLVGGRPWVGPLYPDMKPQLIDEMTKAGLNPANIKYIFIGHRHGDHIGGINLLLKDYALNAIIVADEPDKKWIEDQRASVTNGSAPLPRSLGGNPSKDEVSAVVGVTRPSPVRMIAGETGLLSKIA